MTIGHPPAPPTVEEFTFEQEGAGYVPMFRAAGDAITRGELEHPIHPIGDTIAVLRSIEEIRGALLQQRVGFFYFNESKLKTGVSNGQVPPDTRIESPTIP